MTDDGTTTARLDPLPPRTVGQYVRSRFRGVVWKYLSWATLSIPGLAIIRMRERPQGFSWGDIWLIPVGWAMACVMVFTLGVVGLAIAGWWKLHVKASPMIPAVVLLAAAILGWVYVTTYY